MWLLYLYNNFAFQYHHTYQYSDKKIKRKREKMMSKNRGFEIVKDTCRKTEGQVTLPTRGTKRAMAYDFYANKDYVVEPGKIAKIWTDVKAYMKDGEGPVLNVRSSMGGRFMLANTSGWILIIIITNQMMGILEFSS